MSKIAELREKSDHDLKLMLDDIARERFNLRMQLAMGKQPRPHLFAQAKLTVARIKTILNERQA